MVLRRGSGPSISLRGVALQKNLHRDGRWPVPRRSWCRHGDDLSPQHVSSASGRLVAVPLIAQALAFERLIVGGRNFQFLVSNVASNPIAKHLDVYLGWCSNRSFRTHCSFQVRTSLLDRSRNIVVNCCPIAAEMMYKPHTAKGFAMPKPRSRLRHASVNYRMVK
jgi:hypothetical protein